MAAVGIGSATVGILSLYAGAIDQRKAILSELGSTYATLIARRSAADGANGLSALAGIPLVIPELGSTGELVVARGEGTGVLFLLQREAGLARSPTPIPTGTGLAQPMERALAGETGTMVGRDYQGKLVLAAFRPIPGSALGIVAKIDLTEFRLDFLRSAWLAVGTTFLLVLAGSAVFARTSSGLIERLQESHSQLETLFEHSPISIWEEDYSSVKSELDRLKASGVSDLRAHLVSRPELLEQLAGMVRVLRINETSVLFFGASSKAEVPSLLSSFFDEKSYEAFREEVVSIAEGATSFESEIQIVGGPAGHRILLLSFATVPGHERTLDRVVVSFLDVTKQRHAEEAVRASEERYRTLIERLHAGVVVHAPDSSILLANQQACRMLGLSPSQLSGKKADDRAWLFKRGDGTQMPVDEFPVQQVLATGRPVQNLPVGVHDPTTGEDTWVLTNAFPDVDAAGRLQQVVVTFIDVTERCRGDAELEAISAVFRVFQGPLPLEAAYQELAGKLSSILRFPIVAIETYDSRNQEMVFVGVAGLPGVPPGTRIAVDETVSGTVAMSGRTVVETRVSRRADYVFEGLRKARVETFVCTPLSLEGTVFGTVALADPESRSAAATWARALNNVASIIGQEVHRRRAEMELRESETKYRRLHQSISDAVLLVDLEGHILESNLAYQELLGYGEEALVGRHYLDQVPARWHAQEAEIESSTVLHNGFSPVYEMELERRDGTAVPVEVRRFLVRNGSGGSEAIWSIVRDITGRRHSEAEHLRVQKLDALGTLAAGVAHDFNNVLLAIRGNAALAAESLDQGHPARPFVAEIERAGKKAAGVVRQILSAARPQHGDPTVQPLRPMVEEAVSLLRPIVSTTVDIELVCDAALPDVRVNGDDVLRAIVNLVTNASDAIGSRPGKIRIELERAEVSRDEESPGPAVSPGAYLRLSVSDDGTGMDPQTLQRAFDPFFTTKEPGKGTGLGLSIVHGIMKGLGGSVSLRSSEGEGTVVELLFPAAEAPAAGAPQASAPEGRVRSERILFVDDDEALVFLAENVLRRLGYEVTAFASSTEALGVFKRAPELFDAVVTDLSMPRMSGFDFARQVLEVRPGIPVILTSGYVRPEDEGAAGQIGIRAVILKPNSVEEMGAKLDEIFRNREARESALRAV